MTHPDTALAPALRAGEHYAQVNGLTLHYTVRGSGPVMLVPSPGWGPSVSYLVPLPVLERHCTVVYVDSRHSGRSTGPEQADQYTLAHFVADLEALRVHLGQERVFVAGHSGGGHQALAYGIAHSDHLLGIVAIDALAAADEMRFTAMMQAIEGRRSQPFYRAHPDYIDGALAAMSGADPSLTIQDILDRSGALYFSDPENAALPAMEFDDQVLAYGRQSGFQGDDLLPDLGRITAPTLVLVGADDFTCDPASQAERISAAVPSSTLAVVPGAGHFPWIEQPAAFEAACEAWFRQLAD
jgi:proline iminopeptidase